MKTELLKIEEDGLVDVIGGVDGVDGVDGVLGAGDTGADIDIEATSECIISIDPNLTHDVSVSKGLLAEWIKAGSISDIEGYINKDNINERDQEGFTPIALACKLNATEIVEWLIGRGADVNIKSIGLLAPLMYAVSNDNLHMTHSLIEAGAKINDYIYQKTERWTYQERKLQSVYEFAKKDVLSCARSQEIKRFLLDRERDIESEERGLSFGWCGVNLESMSDEDQWEYLENRISEFSASRDTGLLSLLERASSWLWRQCKVAGLEWKDIFFNKEDVSYEENPMTRSGASRMRSETKELSLNALETESEKNYPHYPGKDEPSIFLRAAKKIIDRLYALLRT